MDILRLFDVGGSALAGPSPLPEAPQNTWTQHAKRVSGNNRNAFVTTGPSCAKMRKVHGWAKANENLRLVKEDMRVYLGPWKASRLGN